MNLHVVRYRSTRKPDLSNGAYRAISYDLQYFLLLQSAIYKCILTLFNVTTDTSKLTMTKNEK